MVADAVPLSLIREPAASASHTRKSCAVEGASPVKVWLVGWALAASAFQALSAATLYCTRYSLPDGAVETAVHDSVAEVGAADVVTPPGAAKTPLVTFWGANVARSETDCETLV